MNTPTEVRTQTLPSISYVSGIIRSATLFLLPFWFTPKGCSSVRTFLQQCQLYKHSGVRTKRIELLAGATQSDREYPKNTTRASMSIQYIYVYTRYTATSGVLLKGDAYCQPPVEDTEYIAGRTIA